MLQALLCLVCVVGQEVTCNPGPKDAPVTAEEISEILTKCEVASRDTRTLKLEFTRIVYNLVFDTETRGEGEVFYRVPNEVRATLRPTQIPRNPPAGRIGRGGRPFRLESDQAAQWIWTLNQQVSVQDADKIFFRRQPLVFKQPLPGIGEINEDYCAKVFNGEPSSSWSDQLQLAISQWDHPDLVCPFLLGVKADNVHTLWSFRGERTNDTKIVLVATPTVPLLKQYYSECRVMIDINDWQTKAIKIVDSRAQMETVYVINARKLNLELPADTFSPDLKSMGYKDLSTDDNPAKSLSANQLTD